MSGVNYMETPRIPNWKKIIYFLFHIFLLGVLSYILIYTYSSIMQASRFQIKKIVIKGNNKINKKKILQIAELNKNNNLLKMNLKIIQAKLLTFPWIKNAEVKRKLPDKIEINIIEEEAAAVFQSKEKYIVNPLGKIFKKYDKSDIKMQLPVIKGLNLSDFEKKSIYAKYVLELIKNEKIKSFFGKKTITIDMDKDTGICLCNTIISKKLIIGFNDFDKKFKKLEKAYPYIEKRFSGQIMKKIDISKKNQIIIKPFPAMG